jgi:DNA-binding NtrC family response regulator
VRTVAKQRILIGRGQTADLVLSDRTVSSCHAELLLDGDCLQVTDLGSRNGVRVGGVTLQRGTLSTGSALALGGTVVLIEAANGPEAPRLETDSYESLVGTSQVMRELYALLDRLASTELSILIQGETGTGKELAARAIHRRSPRTAAPFVVLDCAALAGSLAHSTLFGHEKGAFTGATDRRIGVFEAAHRGTLYIDEVAELSTELQPLLLRALAERTVTPLGGTRPREVDVRIVSASWRDLRRMVNQGKFREDLYFRLAQATVWMPPLRERRVDIPLLARAVLSQLQQRSPLRAASRISAEVLRVLEQAPFPGNIRELRSLIERLAQLSSHDEIGMEDLTFEQALSVARVERPPLPQQAEPAPPAADLEPYKDAKRLAVDGFERQYLERLLARCGNNLSRAAALAGLARQNLRELLRKHGLYAASE